MVGVPMAAIAMSLEVFGPQYGPPTILACGLTYVLTLRLTVYERQLARGRDIVGEGSGRVALATPSSTSIAPVVAPTSQRQAVISRPPPAAEHRTPGSKSSSSSSSSKPSSKPSSKRRKR